MAIVSRRVLKPILGKAKITLERATKYKDIMVSLGYKRQIRYVCRWWVEWLHSIDSYISRYDHSY